MDLNDQEIVERMRHPETLTREVVDQYYTRCIPFYQEILGHHWHTGYYLDDDQPIGPRDQLRMERRIANSASVEPECQILDVGCGIGGPACHLATFTGARIRGLTPNAAQLRLARKLAMAGDLTAWVSFDEGSATALPYADSTFDVVLFFESPCHFIDRHQFFQEAWRVLRTGGRLAGEDWLAADGLGSIEMRNYVRPICETWAISTLGTRSEYASAMATTGFTVKDAVDLRDEMPLLRGFLVDELDRAEVREAHASTADPIRKIILEGLMRLGEAAEARAFTVGRFLAVKD